MSCIFVAFKFWALQQLGMFLECWLRGTWYMAPPCYPVGDRIFLSFLCAFTLVSSKNKTNNLTNKQDKKQKPDGTPKLKLVFSYLNPGVSERKCCSTGVLGDDGKRRINVSQQRSSECGWRTTQRRRKRTWQRLRDKFKEKNKKYIFLSSHELQLWCYHSFIIIVVVIVTLILRWHFAIV